MTRESNTASPPSITRHGTLPSGFDGEDRVAGPDVLVDELVVELFLGHDDAHLAHVRAAERSDEFHGVGRVAFLFDLTTFRFRFYGVSADNGRARRGGPLVAETAAPTTSPRNDARLAPLRPVAARRPLRRQGRRAAPAALRIRPDAPPGAGRGRVVHRAGSDAGFAELAAARPPARAACLRALVDDFSEADAAGDQGDRAHAPTTTSRRSSTGSSERFDGDAELGRRAGVRPLRLHQRGHQQHQPRADAQGARATQVLLPALDALIAHAARAWRTRTPALPMLARTHGQTATPDHASARKSPTSWRAWRRRATRIAAVALLGQDERRGRQLQRARRGLSRLRLGGVRAQASSKTRLGLALQAVHHQIEPHDGMAELFDAHRARQHHPDRLVRATSGATSGWATSSRRLQGRRGRLARPCRTRSTRSTSRTPKATSAWPTRCSRT